MHGAAAADANDRRHVEATSVAGFFCNEKIFGVLYVHFLCFAGAESETIKGEGRRHCLPWRPCTCLLVGS